MSPPHIILIGGDGGRSGVPTHIGHLCDAVCEMARVTVLSDVDRGGYEFAGKFGHVEIPGLATSVNPAAAIGAGVALRRRLRDLQPDLVWAHARMALPLARWAMRQGDLGRLMVTYHGLPFGSGHGIGKSVLSRLIESTGLAVARPHDVVFLTEEDRRALAGWVTGQRTHVLPNSSRLGGFVPRAATPGQPRILAMITRDSHQKNLDLAARIFARLPTDFGLHLYGMGTDSPGLLARFASVLDKPALARVRFCGPTSQVGAALQDACGLLVTSRYEGLSISMIEAMEMGLPVLTTPVGGTSLIGRVHPAFGILTGNPDQDAATIDRVTHDHLIDRAASGSRIHGAWTTNFAPTAWAQRVQSLVRGILDRP